MLRMALMLLIRVYRWVVSPAKVVLFGGSGRCRYVPSCSGYALEAVSRHGAVQGSLLSVGRLCRCHPWGGSGFDPVPLGVVDANASEFGPQTLPGEIPRGSC